MVNIHISIFIQLGVFHVNNLYLFMMQREKELILVNFIDYMKAYFFDCL